MDLLSLFGFRSPPFTREITVHDQMQLPHLDTVAQGLLDAVEARESAALIAPAGMGKTCVLRRLRATLPEARYAVHYVKVTGLSKRDMCREIAEACGAESAGSYPWLVRRLQERFETNLGTDGLRPVLILDEAHDLRPDVLGMLRVLTNFEMDSRLVLSVVIAGQPALSQTLKRADLEDMAQRIKYFGALRPLSREECTRYITHRCAVAGSATTPFDDRALEAIFEMSRGTPRAIDRLALASLEYTARSGGKAVSATEVVAARKHLWPS